MHVKYTGPGRGREIRMPDGRDVSAVKGKPVEVPDDVGSSLVKQRYWEKSGGGVKAAAKADDAKDGDS